ncbi:ferredoxin [Streptomyces sp. NPDC052114]|uniref:ferredoxin n=1 Tax=unclassified Streptomyces TaxID=2593676 RepID=UPI003433E314
MEIRVDRDRCAGSGLCMSVVPAVFDQSEDDGKVLLKAPSPGAGSAAAVRNAAARCPTGAITLSVREESEKQGA